MCRLLQALISNHPMLTMFWSLLVMSSIQLTSNANFTPKLLEGKLIEAGESSSAAAQKNLARGRTHDQDDSNPRLNHMIAEAEIDNFKIVLEANDRGPYFWKRKCYDSKPHNRWTCFDSKGRKIDELNIFEKAREMHRECLVLKKGLLSDEKKLASITIMEKDQNAYVILEMILGQLSTLLSGVFNQKNQRNFGKCGSFHKLHPELKWDILVRHIKSNFLDLEELYLYAKIPKGSSEKTLEYTLKSQVFKILNIFVKYQLIEECVFENWISKEPIKELITRHIIDMFYMPSFLSLDFWGDLLSSRSTEHLGIVSKFLNKELWRYIEYECFKSSMSELLRSRWIHGTQEEIINVARDFCESGFEKEGPENIEKKEDVVKRIIHSFNTSTATYVNSPIFLIHEHLCRMISFVIKFEKELFTKQLQDFYSAQSFYLKMELLDASIRCMKSARELHFFSWKGLYTTELYFKRSKYEITLEQAKMGVLFPQENVDSFRDEFDCTIPMDFHKWMDHFEWISFQRNESPMDYSCCVNSQHYGQKLPEWFGTNFWLKTKDGKAIAYMNQIEEKDERISTLFLTELYEWVERLKFLEGKFRKQQNSLMQILKLVSSKKKENSQKSLNNWIKKSGMMKGIFWEIKKTLVSAQAAWHKIKERIKILNEKINSSPCGSQVQNRSPLKIPEFELTWQKKNL